MKAGISGAAYTLERQIAGGMDAVVQDVIRRALADAAIQLADVDMVITVASDALDGMMVPVRSDMAGGIGKSYLNIPSSAGHALMAAASSIEAGNSETVLLVGWGAASKLAEFDSRTNQFDPFYLRPLGASVATLQAMQEQSLIDQGLISREDVESHASRMSEIIWGKSEPAAFCDGAAAIILQRSAAGLIFDHVGFASRAQIPLDGNLDPAIWVEEVTKKLEDPGFIEICGQSPSLELRALAAIPGAKRTNAHGGSSQGWFGPASPLRNLAALNAAVGEGGPQSGLLIDLAGPLGQHVTAIQFRAGESHAA